MSFLVRFFKLLAYYLKIHNMSLTKKKQADGNVSHTGCSRASGTHKGIFLLL